MVNEIAGKSVVLGEDSSRNSTFSIHISLLGYPCPEVFPKNPHAAAPFKDGQDMRGVGLIIGPCLAFHLNRHLFTPYTNFISQ